MAIMVSKRVQMVVVVLCVAWALQQPQNLPVRLSLGPRVEQQQVEELCWSLDKHFLYI